MKHNRRSIAVAVMCLLVFLLLRFLVNNNGADQSPESEPRLVGSPNISYTYSALEQYSIDQIVEDSKCIYVLYGEHEGNVQVFSHNGEHLYSAYFATHLNGAFNIAAEDDVLYVRDEHRNLYILQNGELLSFYYRDAAEDILDTVDFHASSSNYIVRLGSIWRVDGNNSVCVVKRSPIAALYQGNFMFCMTLLVVAVIGIIGHGYKLRGQSK